MKQLDNAIKNYWYSRGFNKAPDTGGIYQMELDAFSEGWKRALGWALSSGSWENIVNNIKEELNAKA